MASGSRNRTMECPVCFTPFSSPILQCASGHSFCGSCARQFSPAVCPFCRANMTNTRNWDLEHLIADSKIVPCPNEDLGCFYSLKAGEVEGHRKECIYRVMSCPWGDSMCLWTGKLTEMMDHFMDRHPDSWSVHDDIELVFIPVKATRPDSSSDYRLVHLTAIGKFHFIMTMNISMSQNIAFWSVKHIGFNKMAQQCTYGIQMSTTQDYRCKAVFNFPCTTDALKDEEILASGKCAMLPLRSLATFTTDGDISFSFSLKKSGVVKKPTSENGNVSRGLSTRPPHHAGNAGPRGARRGRGSHTTHAGSSRNA